MRYSTHKISVKNNINAFAKEFTAKLRAAFAAPVFAYNFA